MLTLHLQTAFFPGLLTGIAISATQLYELHCVATQVQMWQVEGQRFFGLMTANIVD